MESFALVLIKMSPIYIILGIYEIISAFINGFIAGVKVLILTAFVAFGFIKFICYVDEKSRKKR